MSTLREENQARVLETQISNINTNHALHLILSLAIAGLWIPMWIMITLSNNSQKKQKSKKLEVIYTKIDRINGR